MTYQFQNKPENRPSEPHLDSPKKVEPYIAPDELIDAVNLAIFLRRPLLLEGEAGCGKTRLAIAIAYELGLPFYRWDIRSTTKAQEGLYEYDAILRLHDVQTQKLETNNQKQKLEIESKNKAQSSEVENNNQEKDNNSRDPSNPKDYRTFGAIGKAFISEKPAVVLIDEIDKADIDFPNDLLAVLDEPWEFKIRETGEKITAKSNCQPIVIITSNKEKGNLPAPFLRRCIYYYVKFPNSPKKLQKIVDIHYQHKQEQETNKNINPPDSELIKTAANLFINIRENQGLFKIPGTSEFLDWLDAVYRFQTKRNPKPPYPIDKLKEGELIPYRELIFKIRQDWQKNTTFPQPSNLEIV